MNPTINVKRKNTIFCTPKILKNYLETKNKQIKKRTITKILQINVTIYLIDRLQLLNK